MLKIGKSNAVIKQIKINKIPSFTNKFQDRFFVKIFKHPASTKLMKKEFFERRRRSMGIK
jgi:hypothetical protein